jgi:hypothetical protein
MKGMLIIGKPTGQPDNKGGERGHLQRRGRPESDMSGMAERRAAKDIMARTKGRRGALSKALKAHAEACGYGASEESAESE